MGIPTTIKTLLTGTVVEWARIEFKETWDAEASLKTICAFANDIDNWGGGYLVIGVKDNNGRPDALPGVPAGKIDGCLKDMLNKCKLIQPEYMPITEVVDYKDKKFILVWAPGGSVRPYSSPKTMAKDNKERIYYIRKMASTITPTEEEKRDLYSLANNVPFDDRINHEADIADLNIILIQNYLKEIGSSLYEASRNMDFVDLCKSMNIINALPEYLKPKNVGLMFFSFEPERFFPYAQIDVVQFPDGLGGDRIIEKTFKGPLHQQLREALQYIQNSVIQEQIQKLPDQAEALRFFNFPYAAIEESLSNAVYHKGYDVREPIEVRVLPDRIEIVSHPGADRSITEEGLKNYHVFNRRYRNRRIGEFLKEMHLTEGRNTGFKKILNVLERNGSPMPVFETDPARLSFSTTLFIHPDFHLGEAVTEEDEIGANDDIVGANDGAVGANDDIVGANGANDGAVGANLSENGADDALLAKNEQLIVNYVAIHPRSSSRDMAQNIPLSLRTIQRCLNTMKEKGILTFEGTRKNGEWIFHHKSLNVRPPGVP